MRQRYAIALTLLLACAPVFAQMSGARLAGTVTDTNHAAVTGAKITVTNEATSVSTSTVSGSSGIYAFTGLAPGVYDLKVAASGFETRVYRSIHLLVGQQVGFDASLNVGRQSNTVTVKAESPLIQTQTAQIGTVIDQNYLQNIPTNSRYFLDLAQLAPGVVVNQGTNLGEGLSVNGQRGFANAYIVDGVNDQDSYLQDVRTAIPQDAIQEFQVMTHQMEPQYGQASGAIVDVITRSGTNDLHGSAYGFFRNSVFDANDALDNLYGNPKADTYRSILGGTLGGPIRKSRLFYFGAYEWNKNVSFATITAPQEAGVTLSEPVTDQTYDARVDYDLAKDTFAFRYLGQHSAIVAGPGGSYLKNTEFTEVYRGDNIGVNWNHIFSPNTLGEFRAQYSDVFDVGNPVSHGYAVVRPSSYSGKISSLPFNVPEYVGEALYNLTMQRGHHSYKVGFDYSRVISNGDNRNFGDGIYYFSTDAPYNPNDPSTFPYRYYQRIGPDGFHVPENVIGTFAQDKWNIRPDLVLTYGLRYDWESFFSIVPGTATITGKTIPSYKAEFQPRIAVAYSPWGPRTVIRGGYGLFYSRIPLNEAALIILNTVNTLQGKIINLYDPPTIIPYPTPPSSGAVAQTSTSIDVLDNNLKMQNTDQFTAGISHQFTNSDAIEINAVRALGHNLWTYYNANAPNPFNNKIPFIRPDFGPIIPQSSIGSSWYSDLELSYTHRSAHADFIAAYTLAKAIDDIRGDPNGSAATCSIAIDLNGPSAIKCDRGPSNNDIEHVLTLNGAFQLPWRFRYSTIMAYSSAPPYSESAGYDVNGDGFSNDRPPGVPKNSLRADSYFSWDMRLGNSFAFANRYAFEPFVEAFNITNRANYNSYIGNVLSSLYQHPTGVSDPRRLQFGFRFVF